MTNSLSVGYLLASAAAIYLGVMGVGILNNMSPRTFLTAPGPDGIVAALFASTVVAMVVAAGAVVLGLYEATLRDDALAWLVVSIALCALSNRRRRWSRRPQVWPHGQG